MSEARAAKFAVGDKVEVNGKTGTITKMGLFPTVEGEDGKTFAAVHVSKLKAAASEGPDEADAFEEGDDVVIESSDENHGRRGVISDILGDGEYVVDDNDGNELGTYDESALRLAKEADASEEDETSTDEVETPAEERPVPRTMKDRLKASIQALVSAIKGVPAEESTLEALADTPSEEASEEAAELIEYTTISTLLEQAAASLAQAKSITDDLISDEEDDPTESPEDEAAESEVEAARMKSILTLVTSTISTLYAATNAVQACLAADAADENADGGAYDVTPRYSAEGRLIPPTAEERAALGRRHSEHDLQILQSVHDNSVALGAECPGSALRDAAEAEEVDQQRLEAEEEARSRSAREAAQGEETDMTREERIAALITASAGKTEPYTEADTPWLLTLSNARFSALEAADKLPVTAEEFLDSAPDEIRDLVAKGRAAAAPPVPKTEEEYLKDAPESIRTLVAEKKAADAALKSELIKSLSSSQKEYTEAELQKMPLSDLSRFARALRIDEPATVDFSALGISRAAAGNGEDIYANPPDGYALALERKTGRVQ